MTPGITPIYAATRSALLDALDALAGQHPALILVGAQALSDGYRYTASLTDLEGLGDAA